MPTPDVIKQTRQLQQQLENAHTFPNYTVLKQHVDTALAAPEERAHYTSLRDRLVESSVGAEVAHPELSAAIQGLMASLVTAGI